MWARRQQGKTLRQIGDEFGVSRERIRQVLQAEYRTTKYHFFSQLQVAKKLRCSTGTLLQLVDTVEPKREGKSWLYTEKQVIEMQALIHKLRTCPICGGYKYYFTSRACWRCRRKHRLELMSEEQREHHQELVRANNMKRKKND